ncbi:NAD(P)H-dependent flavin oxidoreductase [Pseudalkalibacillus hwajinpoensis]|uniref:Probable nitronate monooxygenase n=1 Tax=Guptibacillus hwajinpoensis TaxID=208199 RepID=A0A4V5Q210_9BACL|nr:nitronate monooxygenase family protein [Pseudalkalibacillus hwajinpoensis]TKD71808.1 nitronate monooxygenase [Pseudalkalibacillus hwajinpoensis]
MKWNTRLTNLFGIERPIIQGGLAYLAYHELASAVSNAGGLGQLTAMSMNSEEQLRKEITLTKRNTTKPFAVNFAIGQHGRPFEHMIEAALDEGVGIISVTGGNPKPVFDLVKGTDVKVLVLTAGKRQALKAEQLGAAAVMVVGQEGGGHLGKEDTGTMVLVPQVVDALSIPVIASGGIANGRGLMASLALGAEGVEMGTRFIATKECTHAHANYKERILASNETDTAIIKRSIGAPARVIRNSFTDRINNIENHNGDYESLKPYISGEANRKFIYEGREEEGFAWAGQIIGAIQDVPSVEELFNRIDFEAEQIMSKWTLSRGE